MSTTVRCLAELVHGQVFGNDGLLIHSARPLKEAGEGDITFIEHEKHLPALHQSQASAVVAPLSLTANGLTLIRVADPLAAFVDIVHHLHGPEKPRPQGIDPRAVVHPSVCLGPEVSIGAFAVIGEGAVLGARCRIFNGVTIGRNCRLGEDVTLHPNVVLYDGTILGHRVTVHANAVLGADGFGYRLQQGRHAKVPQLGSLEVGDDVEVGACSTMDRGTFTATRIGEGTKIDNLVQVAHNCRIGRHNLLCSQTGVGGSSSTGDYVTTAGQVGVADHVHIGERTIVGGQSGVTKDIPPDQRLFGTPAIPAKEQKKSLVILRRLPEIFRDLKWIKQHLGLEEKGEEKVESSG